METPKGIRILKNDIAVLDGDNFISKWVEQHGRLDHDQSFFGAISKFILPGFNVVEVGAMIGDHTVELSRLVGPDGYIHAFEPNPSSFWCLAHNTRFCTNVQVHNIGLGRHQNHFKYLLNNTNPGASYLGDVETNPDASEQLTVYVMPLDSFNFKPDVIIGDIEGFELFMLQGAEKTIVKHRPVIVLEINRGALNRAGTSAEKVFEWLDVHGYQYRNIYVDESLDGEQLDIICSPV